MAATLNSYNLSCLSHIRVTSVGLETPKGNGADQEVNLIGLLLSWGGGGSDGVFKMDFSVVIFLML